MGRLSPFPVSACCCNAKKRRHGRGVLARHSSFGKCLSHERRERVKRVFYVNDACQACLDEMSVEQSVTYYSSGSVLSREHSNATGIFHHPWKGTFMQTHTHESVRPLWCIDSSIAVFRYIHCGILVHVFLLVFVHV